MSEYTPDKWLLLKIGEGQKVLGGWSGGYLDSDEWRLSSGVENITEEDGHYIIKNHSGSIYKCHKSCQGTTGLSGRILNKIEDKCKDESVEFEVIELDKT